MDSLVINIKRVNIFMHFSWFFFSVFNYIFVIIEINNKISYVSNLILYKKITVFKNGECASLNIKHW